MAVIDDVAQHLHNQGIAVLATSLFKSYMPDDENTPDFCISVKDTGGLQPDRYLIELKEPTFQILVRHTSYPLGKAKLDLIRQALHGTQMETLINGGTFFMFIFAISEGGYLGRDEVGRDLFSINFQCRTR